MKTKNDSIKKRYLYRLFTNIISIPLGIVTQTIVARSLGPALYGDFSFLTNTFSRVISFIETGTSTYFFTKLSQTPEDKKLVRFYWHLMSIVASVVCLIVVFSELFNFKQLIWPNQMYIYVVMAFIYSILIYIFQMFNKMLDANGLTAQGELMRMVLKIFSFLLLVALFFSITINLTVFFIYNYIINIILILSCWYVLSRNNALVFPKIKLSKQDINFYIKGFYGYSHPLILLSLIIFISSMLDIWLLQKVSGSIQQGFYGLAHKIAAICFIFASSITSIIIREYSVLYGKKDIAGMKIIFQKYIPSIYSLIAFISVFISVNSFDVFNLFGGAEFTEGFLVMMVMAIYPIHQTYGQLSGSVFYATGRTKEFRNISLTTIPFGMLLSLFLILPTKYGGLNLGALGLVIKMVFMQLITVNIQLMKNANLLNFSFYKFLFHQFYVIAIYFVIGIVSLLIVRSLPDYSQITVFIIKGTIYSVLVLILFFAKSNIFLLDSKIKFRDLLDNVLFKLKDLKSKRQK